MITPTRDSGWPRFENVQFAATQDAPAGIGLHMRIRPFDGSVLYVESVTVNTKPLDEQAMVAYQPAPITLSPEEAEDLMTALWGAGVRPRSGEGHTAHIQALNKHLEDMRKIAFHQLEIK